MNNVAESEQVPLMLPAAGASLEEIYVAQNERLIALLVRITGDRGRAEELASEALCRVARRPALLRPGAGVEAWLYRTAMNLGLDALKAQMRRSRYERAATIESLRRAREPDPLDHVLRAEQQVQVRTVLASMKPRDAELLLLRHEGFSYNEAAEILKIQVSSIGTLLVRATAEFKTKFEQKYGGGK